jgi:hypothetical protein
MAVTDQHITDQYALYHGDCIETMRSFPEDSVGLSIYSPPFGGLYHYSSSERDLSNASDYDGFFKHYGYVIEQVARLTAPGRMTAVHCAEVPGYSAAGEFMRDLPGDIIRAHLREGFDYVCRYHVWKEPLGVRLRTMMRGLSHQSTVEDASKCTNAAADAVVVFRKRGTNEVPITHPVGFTTYAGSRIPPSDTLATRGYTGKQTENKFSQWVWRQYASAFWDDVRLGRVLPFKAAREDDDEKHVHPLQLDVIDRLVQLWSNPNETVLTPFLGVGSEAYSAVAHGRRGIGIELKASYYRQAVKNVAQAEGSTEREQAPLFTQGVKS